MRMKWYLVVIVLTVIGVVTLITLATVRSSKTGEPVYKGKKLSEWVLELPAYTSPNGQTEAEVALRTIGTNALPYLLKWIDYEPASWKLRVYEVLGRALRRGSGVLFQDRRMLLASAAGRGFGALGKPSGATETALRAMMEDGQASTHTIRNMCITFALNYCEGGYHHIDMRNGRYSMTFPTNGDPILSLTRTNLTPRGASTRVAQ